MSVVEEPLDPISSRCRAREALVGVRLANRYVIRRLIGHGGMGAVYEAEHLGLGTAVAIKLVDPEFAADEPVVLRFAREAQAMRSIESAHIVTVLDVGTEDGRPYLVMELLRGEDLGQWLRRSRRIPLPDALHIVAQVLEGLAKAHAAGIIHRDLKPDNVFLVRSDADPLLAKIVDFGVSKIKRPESRTSPLALTRRGTILGTPLYMSPEQARAMPDVDGRSDLYSLGAVLFECLTGRPPHIGETYEQVILAICMQDAPDPRLIEPTIPAGIASFIGRALARDPAHRYESAKHMLAALHEMVVQEKPWRGHPDVAAEPGAASSASPSGTSPRRRKAAANTVIATAALATLAGMGVTLGAVMILRREPHRAPAEGPLPMTINSVAGSRSAAAGTNDGAASSAALTTSSASPAGAPGSSRSPARPGSRPR